MATSLPAAPMAIDTSPAASAGASLTPSPITATRWPAALLHVVSGLAVVFNSARLVRCGEEIEQSEADRAVGA